MKVNFRNLLPVHTLSMDSGDLFQKYLEVCNRALEANRGRFPFKQILGAAKKQAAPRNVEVCIIDDHPEAAYVIHMDQDRIAGKLHEACVNCKCDGRWRVRRSYLEEVIKNPQTYIDNPAKIDWEWMYDSEQQG